MYSGLREQSKLQALRNIHGMGPSTTHGVLRTWQTLWNLCRSCVYVMTIASGEGRNANDAGHPAVLVMTPHSKYGAAQLSHYSD